MTSVRYEDFINHEQWQSRPPLSRIILGARKARGLALKDVVAMIAPDDPTAFDEVLAFETSGEVIRRGLFERLVELLDLDRHVVRRVIGDRRRADEDGYNREVVNGPNHINIQLAPMAGTGQSVRPGTTKDEAIRQAGDLARRLGRRASLRFDGMLIRVDAEGAVTEEVRLVAHSAYPFATALSTDPVDDGWDGDVTNR